VRSRHHAFDWHAIVAVILAIGAASTIILLPVMELTRDGHVTEAEATLLSTALGAAIGAVATYLGGADQSPLRDGGPASAAELVAEEHVSCIGTRRRQAD
jgi:hypothetical protein